MGSGRENKGPRNMPFQGFKPSLPINPHVVHGVLRELTALLLPGKLLALTWLIRRTRQRKNNEA
jgi:hypothetical protein